MRRLTWIGMLVGALACGSVCGNDEPEASYSAAEFEFATGPEVIVLAVHSAANFGKTSVLLYGDGRVEIQHGARASDRRITFQEMRAVISKATVPAWPNGTPTRSARSSYVIGASRSSLRPKARA